MKLALALATAGSLCGAASAHMWFEQPVNRGGIGNQGGTGADCAGRKVDSGARTELIAGSTSEMIFRVNQHGQGDGFHLTYAAGKTDAFATGQVLLTGFKYTIPDTGDRSVKVKYTVPSTLGDGTLQLKGMGKITDGKVTGRWYSCSDIKIVAPPSCPAACETGTPRHGVCQGTTCKCNDGFVGTDCSTAVSADGAVAMELTLRVTGANFDQPTFVAALAEFAGVDVARITVISVDTSMPGETSIVYKILDSTTAGTASAVEVSGQLKTAVENDQLNIPNYPVLKVSTAPASTTPGGDDSTDGESTDGKKKSSSNGGAIAAGILVPLCLIGVGIGGFMLYKKKQAGGSRSPMIPPRDDAPPPLPARV